MAVLKDLIVHGPSRFLNGIYSDSIHSDLIDANSGVFRTITTTTLDAGTITTDMLKANNARVAQTLTVDGTISTNKWEAASIANIGGNFYISPTGKSDSGTITVTKTGSTTINGVSVGVYTLVVGGTFGVTSTNDTIWGNNSKVIFTGSISYNDSKKFPLGSCSGTMTTKTTGTNTLTGFTITGVNSSALDIFFKEVGIASASSTACNGYEMQISVYQSYSNSNLRPVGILLTSYGKEKKQYIDIYGGSNVLGDADSGFADPEVRIGQLDGLPNIVDGSTSTDTKPTGWGIYTTNGFFKGKIVANAGRVGNWVIENGSSTYGGAIYTGSFGSDNGIFITPSYTSSTAIGGSSGSQNWTMTASNKFGVTKTGYLYASKGKIAGWIIDTNNLSTGTVGSQSGIKFSNSTFTATINGTSRQNLMMSIGSRFGVDRDGSLYASEAVISGAITANSLNVGSVSDPNHLIYNSSTGVIDLSTSWLKFVSNAVIIGKDNESHISIDYHSFTMQDSEDEFFRVEDKRNSQGIATITDTSPVIEKYNSWQSSSQYKTIVTDCYPEEINSVIIQNAENSTQTTDVTEDDNVYTQNATYLDNLRFDRSNLPYTKNIIKIEYTTAEKAISFTFGSRNSSKNVGKNSFASGSEVIASGSFSHVEGGLSEASGSYSHAEGTLTIASGQSSHAEGDHTKASGTYSHAEGLETEAMGLASHAKGYKTIAYGDYSHAEGNLSQSFGEASHAQGNTCWTYGDASFATGIQSAADGEASNALGEGAYAQKKAQTVIGTWCDEDTSTTTIHSSHNTDYGTYALIIGNGEAYNTKSNALTVDWKGVVSHYGDVTNTLLQIPPNSSTISSVTYAANSGGKITEISFTKKGNLAMIRFQVTSTSAISSGSNILTAQLVSKYHPAQYATGVGYYGGHAIVGRINASGQLIIRNASSSGVTLASSNGGVEVAFTYILKNYFV